MTTDTKTTRVAAPDAVATNPPINSSPNYQAKNNNQPSQTPQEALPQKAELQQLIAKYQTAAKDLTKFNQDKIRQQTLTEVVTELAASATDHQRASIINHISQHLQNPQFALDKTEQRTYETLQKEVFRSIQTTKNADELTDSLHRSLKNNRDLVVSDRDAWQKRLGEKIKQVPDLATFQQAKTQILKSLADKDPQPAIAAALEEGGVADAKTISEAISSQAITQILTKPDISPTDVQSIISKESFHIPPETQSVIQNIVATDQLIISASPRYHQTIEQFEIFQIGPQDIPTFFSANQFTPQTFHQYLISYDQPQSNRQPPVPSINTYIQTYRRLISISSKSSFTSFWTSPQATIKSWFQTIGSNTQIKSVNFFQNLFSGGGVSGGSKSNISQQAGSFIKSGAKQGFGKLGGLLKRGARGLAKFGRKAAVSGAKALAQLLTKIGPILVKLIIATWPFWVAAIAISFVAGIFYVIAGASPQKVALMQADSISGQGGSGMGLGFCDPEVDENCIPLFCEGDCMCPVTGYITQAPGGDFTHLRDGNPVNAVDIGLTTGDPIYSLSSGVVSFAAYSPAGYGNLVVVDNPDGTQLYYAHLEWFNVSVGQQVAVGERLGAGDNTGFSTGPHLHLEYRGAGAQNVLALIGFSPEQIEVLNGCSGKEDCGNTLCQN
jgi:murein DD-endopeptidase MepM/ murein hydrolase activator NlpD